jgi:hypothetical protein
MIICVFAAKQGYMRSKKVANFRAPYYLNLAIKGLIEVSNAFFSVTCKVLMLFLLHVFGVFAAEMS